MDLRGQIRSQLTKLHVKRLDAACAQEAAVLMPIFVHNGEPHFLLTRRTEQVRTHKGQISFPGGMRQEQETLQETALRETREEVGLEPSRIEILGRFHDYVSITGYLVVPFAGYIEGAFITVPQKTEVAEVLQVPFSIFADPTRLRTVQMLRSGIMRDVYFYQWEPHEIWGLTAHIIKEFFEAIRLDAR